MSYYTKSITKASFKIFILPHLLEDNFHLEYRHILHKLIELGKNKVQSDKYYIENIERLILENKIVLGSPIIKKENEAIWISELDNEINNKIKNLYKKIIYIII